MDTDLAPRPVVNDSMDELLMVAITDYHDVRLELATVYSKLGIIITDIDLIKSNLLGNITTDLDIIKSNFADQLDQDNARMMRADVGTQSS